MRRLRATQGYTIVELVIVLAISSMLIVGVVAGVGTQRQQTSFSTAIEAVKSQIANVKNEAFSGVSERENGGNSAQTYFGKLVEFDNSNGEGDPTVTTSTLVANTATSNPTQLYKCDTTTTTLKEGVAFRSADVGGSSHQKAALIFQRDPDKAYAAVDYVDPPDGGSACSPDALDNGTFHYTQSACVNGHALVRTLEDPMGNCQCPDNQVEDSHHNCGIKNTPPSPQVFVVNEDNTGYFPDNPAEVMVAGVQGGNTVELCNDYTNTCQQQIANGNATFFVSLPGILQGKGVHFTARQIDAFPNNWSPTTTKFATYGQHYLEIDAPEDESYQTNTSPFPVHLRYGQPGTSVDLYTCYAFQDPNPDCSATGSGLSYLLSSSIQIGADGTGSTYISLPDGRNTIFAAPHTGDGRQSNYVTVTVGHQNLGLAGSYYHLAQNGGGVAYSGMISYSYDLPGSPLSWPGFRSTFNSRTDNQGGANEGSDVEWRGYLTPDAQGSYVICASFINGAYVDVAGYVIFDWPGEHEGVTKRCVSIFMLSSFQGQNPITIYYHSYNWVGGGAAAFKLTYRKQFGSDRSEHDVPAAWFTHFGGGSAAAPLSKPTPMVMANPAMEAGRPSASQSGLTAVASSLAHLVLPKEALADSCGPAGDLLDPKNYTAGCFGANLPVNLTFELLEETDKTATVTVSADGTVTRSLP